MTNKNTHDRKYEVRRLNMQDRFATASNIADIRRMNRQILRNWAVAGRRAFGTNSVEAYCDYIARNNFIEMH